MKDPRKLMLHHLINGRDPTERFYSLQLLDLMAIRGIDFDMMLCLGDCKDEVLIENMYLKMEDKRKRN